LGIYNVGGMLYNGTLHERKRITPMHTLQWVVVEADDKDSAVGAATVFLEEEMGSGEHPATWYDWFLAGGGRWNTEQDELGFTQPSNLVIDYKEEPNAFRAKIDELIQARIDQYNEYLSEVKQIDIMALLENYEGVMTYSMDFYALSRLLDYQRGIWSVDSKFYDLVHWSTNATHILSKLDKNEGDNLFLVPIDFHF